MNIIFHINWLAVVVGAAGAFVLGSVWFSPKMFGVKWNKGLGVQSVPHRKLSNLLIFQAVGSFLFAWTLVIIAGYSLPLAILTAIAAAAMTKANGFFSGKSVYTIIAETVFVLVQAAIIIFVWMVIK